MFQLLSLSFSCFWRAKIGDWTYDGLGMIVDDGVIVGIDGSDDEGAIVVVVMDPDWVGGCAS